MGPTIKALSFRLLPLVSLVKSAINEIAPQSEGAALYLLRLPLTKSINICIETN